MTPQANRRAALRAAEGDQSGSTRARLIAAFREAAAMQLDRPSATWICDRAGVGRSTYYTHFATVDELAAETITESWEAVSHEDVARRTGPHSGRDVITREGLGRVVSELTRSRELIEYATRIGSRALVLEHLVQRFERFTSRTVAAEFTGASPGARALITSYISAGTVHALFRWLEEPSSETAETVIQAIFELLPATLTADRPDRAAGPTARPSKRAGLP
ncbi:hypothetical protein D3228_09665 [Leucobacter luti]|nr:hypothetical protein [Leucobacter luti]